MKDNTFFYSKNLFFFYCSMKQWGEGLNIQHTKITLFSMAENCISHHASGSKVNFLVPLGQGHQVGVHFSLCQNPKDTERQSLKV